MAQHKVKLIWKGEMEDQLVDLWQHHECLYNVSCKTFQTLSLKCHPVYRLGVSTIIDAAMHRNARMHDSTSMQQSAIIDYVTVYFLASSKQ